MTITKTTLTGVLALGLIIFGNSLLAKEAPELLDRVVAVVNQDVVTLREYEQEVASIRAKIAAQGQGSPPEELIRKQALKRVILIKLQMNEAHKLGVDVDDATLSLAIDSIAKRNQMTLDDMREMLDREGVSFEIYREDLRQQITLTRLHQKEVVGRIRISEAQVDNYLANSTNTPGGKTAVHIRHILLATSEGASSQEIDARKNHAQQLKEQLASGGDFPAAAINQSNGRQALDGGDLGWLEIGQAPNIFIEALVTMERGDVAGPIQSSSGFHIIKLEDYRGGERSIVDQTHVRHILIRTNELTSDNDARNRLEQLHTRITGGDDFEALARSHSDDKTSAIKGGDLGWASPGDLVPKFVEVMEGLDVNELSEPFRTPFGWHIVQVLERRAQDVTNEARREKAREALRKQRKDEALELYLRKLLDQAYIEEHLDE